MENPEMQRMLAQVVLTLEQLRADFQTLKEELSELKHMPQIMDAAAEGWLSTSAAAAALRSEGIKNPKHLKQLLAIGVLWLQTPDDTSGQVRDVSRSPGRSTYEFHIPSCRPVLQQFFVLSAEERKRYYGNFDSTDAA